MESCAVLGALGVVFIAKSWKLAVIPTVLMVLLFIMMPGLFSSSGIFIPVMSVVAVLIARLLYKKNRQ
jgi:hypothetical protein